ncbi:hypothetical protein BHU09_02065 [Tannerella sp. oral taxon 808]|nr:hypothetical protein BHU09_02065 [Tannerella sp. oral taxon 808]
MRGVMGDRTARVFYALAAVVAVAYFALVGHFADNIPFWDDYLAEQNFLVRFLQSPDLSERLRMLIEQHNEHRLLFTRLTTLAVYLFTGKLNYAVYIILANAMLIGTGLLMYKTINDDRKKAFGAFLIALLLCNGQHLETSVWAMSGLANIGTLFLAIASLYCVLRRETAWVVAGFALSVLTVFSNGNGMFILIPALIGLALQRRTKTCAAYAIVSSLSVALYFLDYVRPERTDIGLMDILTRMPQILINLCTFAGLNFWVPSLRIVSIAVGAFCLSVYLWGIWKGWYRTDLFSYASLTFLYLTAGAVAVVWVTGEVMGALRYRMYSSPILIFTLLLLLSHSKIFQKRCYVYTISGALLLYCFSSTIYIQKEQKRLEFKLKSTYNWEYKRRGLATWSVASSEQAIPYLQAAERMGLYRMPRYPMSKYASSIVPQSVGSNMNAEEMPHGIDSISMRGGYLIIEGWAFLRDCSMNFSDISLCLISPRHSYVCTSLAERRYDLKLDVPLDRIEHCGFFSVIDTRSIEPGTYRIGIEIRRLFDKQSYCILAEQTVEVKTYV